MPTHDEVQDLIGRVAALSEKVDALTKQRAAPTPASDTSVYHVVPHDEGWAVEKEGADRATSVHGTKAEAVSAGRERAKAAATGRLVVHRQDGTIQDSFSYGE